MDGNDVPVTTPLDLADERFVSLTTYRRSGVGVATAVWVVADGDALLVWTVADSGKVKRLRNNPRVDLAPCSRRGEVAPDAPHVAGTVTVTDDPAELARVTSLLHRKHGWEYRGITALERVVGLLRRRRSDRVVLRIVAA